MPFGSSAPQGMYGMPFQVYSTSVYRVGLDATVLIEDSHGANGEPDPIIYGITVEWV
jgi:hypothetical protein